MLWTDERSDRRNQEVAAQSKQYKRRQAMGRMRVVKIEINGDSSHHNKTGMNAKKGRGDDGRKKAGLILLDEHGHEQYSGGAMNQQAVLLY